MKEVLSIRINEEFVGLLFRKDEGHSLENVVRLIDISKDDPRYMQIPIISQRVRKKYGKSFYFGWNITRSYTSKEIEQVVLFHTIINSVFEPAGEECGTRYDEGAACEVCGVNRRQIGPLILKRSKIPKKDIAKTIAGEVIVSDKFVRFYEKNELSGVQFAPVYDMKQKLTNYYQLIGTSVELTLSPSTVTGINPFEDGSGSDGASLNIYGHKVELEPEVYKCPKGHLIGLTLLSEPVVKDSTRIKDYDLFTSEERIGVKRGLLRPEPLYFCSPRFRKMVLDEKLTGFLFERANIE